MHEEFVVKMKNGSYDWIDPVEKVEVVTSTGGNATLVVTANTGFVYEYPLEDVANWLVREYDAEHYYPFG